MPVFDRAVDKLIRECEGDALYNNATGTMQIGDRILSARQREQLRDHYEVALANVIKNIDWNRVLLEATSRHLALNHPEEGFDGFEIRDGALVIGVMCPECVEASLLVRETLPKWSEK